MATSAQKKSSRTKRASPRINRADKLQALQGALNMVDSMRGVSVECMTIYDAGNQIAAITITGVICDDAGNLVFPDD